MKKIISFLLKIIILIFIVSVITVLVIFHNHGKELPDVQKLLDNYRPATPTTIYDRNNKEVDILYTESREVAKIDEIPDYLKDAFISIEDKKFYSHHGIDIRRLAGAIFINIKSGRARQGASSITQQLAKNAFLTPERKLSRKIKEAIITLEMERTYTKDEILEKYLNEIYFGSGSYGVKTAAKNFFKKDIKDLNLAESALLAGIPNRPSKYDPVRHLDNALSRQKIILREMYRDNRISEEEYKTALNHKFEVENEKNIENVPKDTTIIYRKSNKNFYKNPEFTALVEEYLEEVYPEDKIYTGGLKVYTTLDLDFQNVAREVFDNYSVFKDKSLEGAMITLDPFSGGIISIVGGRDFKAKNFDRALMAKRQFGSSFKPFLYLSALKNGFTTYSVVVDEFISYGSWKPKNTGGRYSGNSSLLNSLRLSINIPAIKLLDKIGVEDFNTFSEYLQYSGKVKDLTAALGSIDGTPLNLAIDFSIFVNGGYIQEPKIIKEIRDSQDTLIYVADSNKEKVFDSVDTSIVMSMLKMVVENGTGGRAKVLNKKGLPIEQGGKTGTTNQNRTVWYAGVTPEYVTVCYIGRDDNKPLYGRFSGGGTVAPLWKNYYDELIKKDLYVPGKFEFLENYIETGDIVKQNINLYTGLLDDETGKKFNVRKGRLQVESMSKYKSGIASVFGLDEYVGTTSGFGEFQNENFLINEGDNSFNDIENTQREDDLLNRLLGE